MSNSTYLFNVQNLKVPRHPREMSRAEDDAAFVAAMIRAGYSKMEAEKHLASHHRALEEGDEAFMLRAGAARRIRDLSES
jgi:hypothetical protein